MRILLLGAQGQVGWELQRSLSPLGEVLAHDRASADLEDLSALRRRVAQADPRLIVNAAAYTAVDKAETDEPRARRINAEAVGLLAEEARARGAWLVHYSTDYVYDGTKPGPYLESDACAPLSAYGRTKREGEEAIAASGCAHFVFRTSWVFASRGANFVRTVLRLAAEREELKVVSDQVGAPTGAELIADVTALAVARLQAQPEAMRAAAGIYHLTASGSTDWNAYARFVLQRALDRGAALKLRPGRVHPIPTSQYPLPARRPANSVLDLSRLRALLGVEPPPWQWHVARAVDELVPQSAQAGVPGTAKGGERK